MSGCWFRFVFISSKLCRLISGMCVYNNMNNVSCWNVIVWCVLAMWDVYRMSYDVSCMVYMEVYVGGGGGDGSCMVVVQLLCVVLGCGSSHCLFS